MSEENEILFDIRGKIGFITLNRPQTLNALTLNMIRLMDQKLVAWAKDPDVRAVIVTGAGDRAFCSGGDVKAVALDARAVAEGKSDGKLGRNFFYEEYTLNHRIFTFPKPYIALINGIVMGGGKGISAHGSHRIVTENILFAMPETNIGFFPDVGGGYFLPRCPGQTGLYLALTSKRIKAVDAVYIGFATHFVPAAKMQALVDAIVAEDNGDVGKVIGRFAEAVPGTSEIAPQRKKIDLIFGQNTVEDIIAGLRADASEWAKETLKAIEGMSPSSLKIALRQIRRGATMKFSDVMTMEFRLSQSCIKGHDFYEGIRAALIDKDRTPKWEPSTPQEVSDSTIEGYFQSLGDQDLIF